MMKPFPMWAAGRLSRLLTGCVLFLGLASCTASAPEAAPTVITFRNWEGDISAEIFEEFQAETGMQVLVQPYDSQEQALEDLRQGIAADVVVLENQLIPGAVAENLLAEIDFQNVPNFNNISPNFRDLAYSPRNRHAIPYSWGSTGIVARRDLVDTVDISWSIFWDERYAGKVMAWPLPRYLVGMALKSLGYSVNSQEPRELNEAEAHLMALKGSLVLREWSPAVAAPYLVSGETWLAMGQADDVIEAKKLNPDVVYLFPVEGGILWGDNFTIPANSANKAAAERLINFLLRAEISARIMNETYYWLPNDAALPLVEAELRANQAIFPSPEMLANAEIMLALSPETEARVEQIWARFTAP